jgi:hypothetical protein
MNITALAHRTVRKLTVIGLLAFPLVSLQSHAVELVGKPVAVDRHSSAAASSNISSAAETAAHEVVLPEPPEAPEPSEFDSAKEEIKQAVDDIREDFNERNHDHDDTDLGDFMSPDIIIPIVAMSLLFGGPVLLVIILAILHYRSKSRRQKNINMNIDKLLAAGRDIPVELLLGEEPRVVKATTQAGDIVYTRSDDMMRKGIRNIGLGVGWLIFLTIMFGIKVGSFGFIFIGLGISQVVIWKLSDNSSTTAVIDTVKVQD